MYTNDFQKPFARFASFGEQHIRVTGGQAEAELGREAGKVEQELDVGFDFFHCRYRYQRLAMGTSLVYEITQAGEVAKMELDLLVDYLYVSINCIQQLVPRYKT